MHNPVGFPGYMVHRGSFLIDRSDICRSRNKTEGHARMGGAKQPANSHQGRIEGRARLFQHSRSEAEELHCNQLNVIFFYELYIFKKADFTTKTPKGSFLALGCTCCSKNFL